MGKRTCSEDDCEAPVKARGLCDKHLSRWYRRGTTSDPTPISVVDRFRAKVEVDPGGCWEWTGKRHYFGYGGIKVKGRMIWTHRFAYELFLGPIPPGMFVLHRCDNPPCCNPFHLWLGTAADNVHDMDAKGRRRPRGPDLNGETRSQRRRRLS